MSYNDMVAKAAVMTDQQLADAQFILNMVDRWQPNDWTWNNVLNAETAKRRANK